MTRVCTATASGDAAEAARELISTLESECESPVLVLVFASVAQPLAELLPIINEAFDDAVVMGSSSYREFTESHDTESHAVAVALSGDIDVTAGFGSNLAADPQAAVSAALKGHGEGIEGKPHRTGLILLDPLTGVGEETALLASALLGNEVRLAGGAAGDADMTRTWVGLGDQVASDAVAIAVLHTAQPLGIGVDHGHEPISEQLEVTRASGPTVYEINGRPAWDVWKEKTRESASKRGIDVDTLPEDRPTLVIFLGIYEAGLLIGDNYKIRAPLAVNGEDKSISFACGIPEGAVIRITEGNPRSQIDSARAAAHDAREQLGGRPVAGALVFDCACRKSILGDQFKTALDAIHDELDAPFGGFETYGEIALEVGQMSGFHNTTTVVVAFPES